MKKFTLALTTATALISAPALAADLGRMPPRAPVVAPVPYFNWSGFYLGIQGGFAWGELERTLVSTGATLSRDTDGGLIGGTVGFNWQTGAWVFGFEADYAWADIGRSVNDCFLVGVVCRGALETFGTARLRVGGAWDRVMIYGTGGFAFGDHVLRITDTVTGLSAERSDFAVGWTAGGGIEWGFAPGWSLKAEALYFDLEPDRLSTVALGVVDPVGIDARHTGVIVRGGINYRFNWGGPGVVASY
jgi:outer membrane immunogenic protein